MMNFGSTDDIVNELTLILWPMIRITAFLLAAPLFSLSAVNLRIRIMIGLMLTVFTYNAIEVPFIDPMTADGLWQILVQIFIGVIMGFILQIVGAAVVVGGEAISNSIGLGFATMVDPNMGNVPLISQLLVILSTFIFLTLGGHLFVIQLLFESFTTIPIGEIPPLEQWLSILFAWLPYIFAGALNLGLSMMTAMLILNIGLGVVTRSAPALNIIAVGFPAILLVGLLALNLNITGIVYAIQRLWSLAIQVLQSLTGA